MIDSGSDVLIIVLKEVAVTSRTRNVPPLQRARSPDIDNDIDGSLGGIWI